MPTGPLPPSDNYLGDGDRTTGEFQAELNNLQNWARQFQAQLDALSSTTPGEAFSRGVGLSANNLPSNADLGTAAYRDSDQNLNTTDSVSFSRIQSSNFDSDLLQTEISTVVLDGGFSTGSVTFTKIGDIVLACSSSILTHSSASVVQSSVGLIPSAFRPTSSIVYNAYHAQGSGTRLVSVKSDGQFGLTYVGFADTDSFCPVSIVYKV